jgi:hypothetical protein
LKIILEEFYFKDQNSIGMQGSDDILPYQKLKEEKPHLFGNNESFAKHLITVQKSKDDEDQPNVVYSNCEK